MPCALEVAEVGWDFAPLLRRDQVEEDHDDVGKSNGEEGQEEPIVPKRNRLEELPRVLTREVEELVQAKKASCAEVCPRVVALEADLFPE